MTPTVHLVKREISMHDLPSLGVLLLRTELFVYTVSVYVFLSEYKMNCFHVDEHS